MNKDEYVKLLKEDLAKRVLEYVKEALLRKGD